MSLADRLVRSYSVAGSVIASNCNDCDLKWLRFAVCSQPDVETATGCLEKDSRLAETGKRHPAAAICQMRRAARWAVPLFWSVNYAPATQSLQNATASAFWRIQFARLFVNSPNYLIYLIESTSYVLTVCAAAARNARFELPRIPVARTGGSKNPPSDRCLSPVSRARLKAGELSPRDYSRPLEATRETLHSVGLGD